MKQASNDEIRDTLAYLAHWTWDQMNQAHKLGLSFNEETITESLLLKLAQKFSSRGLDIKSFSKDKEGKKYLGGGPTGADWEFWISDNKSNGLKLRVQAKRLFLKSGKYESLHPSSTQHTHLQSNAKKHIASPLYVFYNGRSHNTPSLIHGIYCCHYPFPFFWQSGVWGCSFAHAEHLTGVRNQPKPEDIPTMLPWHCLLCPCRSGGNMSLPKTIKNSIDHFADESGVELTPTPPDWVGELQKYSGSESASTENKPRLPKGVSHVVHIEDSRDFSDTKVDGK